MAAKADGRKAIIRNAGDSKLLRKVSVVGDVVLVLKAIVPNRELIDAAATDRPRMRYAHLRAANNLPFDRINGLAREGRETSAVPVEAVPVIPGERAPKLLLAGENVIDFAGVSVP